MTRLLYVTGVSGAGKTTLGRALADYDGAVGAWWDLDEDADQRPRTNHLGWLRWRAAEYLVEATDMAAADGPEVLVVTGIVWPFEVINSSAWPAAFKNPHLVVEWLMLDPRWRVIKERLNVRNADKPKADQKALLAYNRELRDGLRRQVLALRYGAVCTEVVNPEDHALGLLGLTG